MARCLIGLGSNLGDRRATLHKALDSLRDNSALRLVATSGLRQTLPVGGPSGQQSFLNAAATIETSLQPISLLAVLLAIEKDLGRNRDERWGPRTIDLDLLLYDAVELEQPELVLPHPRMAWRRFVLEPAAEVAPAMIHPTTGWTVARLLDHLDTSLPYVALAGPIGAGKSHLAGQLAQGVGARRIDEQVDARRLEAFYANPTGSAWQVEIEFLQQRARLLGVDQPCWLHRDRPLVSDFWFEQSLAFAGVWLPAAQRAAFEELWREARIGVVEPRLIVLLDVPLTRLLRRIRDRGRPGEQALGPDILQKIREAILARAGSPGHGPLLRLDYDDPAEALCEVTAALESME